MEVFCQQLVICFVTCDISTPKITFLLFCTESEGTLILPQVESVRRRRDDDATTITSDDSFFSAAEVDSSPLLLNSS